MNALYQAPQSTQNSLTVEVLRIKHITNDQERLIALEELLNRVQAQILTNNRRF